MGLQGLGKEQLRAATREHASPEPLVVGFALASALRIVAAPIGPNKTAAVTALEIAGAVLLKINISIDGSLVRVRVTAGCRNNSSTIRPETHRDVIGVTCERISLGACPEVG